MSYPPFDYVRPISIEEALSILKEDGAKVIAGGTDLMISLRLKKIEPSLIVDISHIKELEVIEEGEDRVSIGALVTHAEVAASPVIKKLAKGLLLASLSVGGPQIRNLGTIGGNIVNASPAADTIPALVCLNAVLHLRSKDRERKLPITEFITAPYKTCIESDEVLTHISFSRPKNSRKWVFIKVARRASLAISRLNLALSYEITEGRFKDVRLSIGSVTPRPSIIKEVKDFLEDRVVDKKSIIEASKIAFSCLSKISGNRPTFAYKGPVIKDLVIRAFSDISGVEV